MPPRPSDGDPLTEFHRLADAFDAMDECAWLGHDDPARFGGARLGPLDRSRAIAWLADGTARPRDVISGMKEALNDLSRGVADLLRSDPGRAAAVLAAYRARTGRDYWSDAGHPERLLRAVLKRGSIADETEFRLVTDYASSVDGGALSDADRAKAEALLARFEKSAARPE